MGLYMKILRLDIAMTLHIWAFYDFGWSARDFHYVRIRGQALAPWSKEAKPPDSMPYIQHQAKFLEIAKMRQIRI